MNQTPLPKRPAVVLCLILVLLGTAYMIGRWSGTDASREPRAAALDHELAHGDAGMPVEADAQVKLYACPMMCTPPLAAPGECPVCGMALAPVEGGELTRNHNHDLAPAAKGGWQASRIELSAQAIQLADIRVAPVIRQAATAEISLFGKIDYDPAHMTKLSAFMPGVIDRVYVKRAGQFVRWGDPLFDIYSSDLQETQKQLIELMPYVPSFLAFQSGQPHVAQEVPVQDRKTDTSEAGDEQRKAAYRKMAAIRHKLSILGLPKRDIDELMKVGEATGIATVYASMYGQVVEQNAYEGTYINTGTTIFTLADPKYVWARLDAYETDFPWLRKGQAVRFETTAYPGERFTAKVVYIDPVFNPETRTFSVGALLAEQGGRLKAGMLIRATVQAQLDATGQVAARSDTGTSAPLLIPSSAPLITGRRAVVYVAVPGEAGQFEGREIVLGPKARDHYVVLDGLQEGEQVVFNGNFKIDSAIQILARSSMMTMQDGDIVESYQHAGSASVNRDYLEERLRSRMPQDRENTDMSPAAGSQGHTFIRSRRATPSDRPSAVQRRRPGSYGDSTRRSTRALDP